MTSVPLQSSEELSDSETPSAIGLCIEDDKEFIRNARARTMANDVEGMIEGGKRVVLLWDALRMLPSSLRQRVSLKLLEDSDHGEDVWLWNEGDEALMEWEWDWSNPPPPWTSAAAALERRLTRTPAQTLRRREVQSAAFEMRAAMIAWLALASAAYKSADKERGVRDREKWDMQKLIVNWWRFLPRGVQRWLDHHSESYDDCGFTEAMAQAGHSCHKAIRNEVTCWLFMRSQLSPGQQHHIIFHLGYRSCTPCLAHKLTRGSDLLPSWTPSPALVALRFIWNYTTDSRDFSEWLSDQPIYGLTEVNDFFNSLLRDTDEDRYLSWVNKYPSDLRDTVTQYSLEEWEAMDDCLTGSERGGSLNIRSWCAAMSWRMMPPGLSYSDRVKRFIDGWRYSVHWRLNFLPPSTSASEFRDAIRESGHTCWEEWEMYDYATAMAFLEEDLKVVGIDVKEGSECQVCRLQWRLQELGETLPVEKTAFSVDLTEVLVMLRIECSRRNVSWNEIVTYVEEEFVADSDSLDSSEEAETSDAGSDVDEASDEDERAPGALIHPSQVNTAGHGENNPSSGVIYDNEAADVDEESADMTGPLIFTNPPSENAHLYSMGPVNIDEAHLITETARSFEHIPDSSSALHMPRSDWHRSLPLIRDQTNTHSLYVHGEPFSSPQQNHGAVDDAAHHSNQGLSVRRDGLSMESFEAGYTISENEQDPNWTGSTRISVSNLIDNVPDYHQQGMHYVAPQTFSTNHPMHWRESSSNIYPQHDMHSLLSARTGTNTDNTPHFAQSLPPVIPSKRNHRTMTSSTISSSADSIPLPLRQEMIDQIKKFLTDAMEDLGIHLQYKGNEPKLPWIDFKSTLKANRVRMEN
ncbi:hypothetical protein C8J56DRAFT_1026848, partial [Mycena floridula]